MTLHVSYRFCTINANTFNTTVFISICKIEFYVSCELTLRVNEPESDHKEKAKPVSLPTSELQKRLSSASTFQTP